jgi:DNA-nicking Smr family endonuclease
MNKNKNTGNGKKGPDGRISGEDHRLWDFVIKTVTPLSGRKHIPQGAESPPSSPKMQFWRPGLAEIRLKDKETALSSLGKAEKTLDRQTETRFRQGKMPIEAVLDLHGMHQAGAQNRLFSFLRDSSALGRRCVLVITGKGAQGPDGETGVLRRMLPLWLEMEPVSDLVLSVSPARPRDGGSGAFYILLRRQRSKH